MAQVAESLPQPPYYAAIFTSQRTPGDDHEYAAVAARMSELAQGRPGFLGMTSLRSDEGLGVTLSYWSDLEALHDWRFDAEHRVAQQRGRLEFYRWYRLEVCRVDRSGEFGSQLAGA